MAATTTATSRILGTAHAEMDMVWALNALMPVLALEVLKVLRRMELPHVRWELGGKLWAGLQVTQSPRTGRPFERRPISTKAEKWHKAEH